MFFKKKPTIREFLFGSEDGKLVGIFDKNIVVSDEKVMEAYVNKYMGKCILYRNWSAIGKKCESLRKQLSEYRSKGVLRIESRIKKGVSEEIFYSKR